MLLYIWKEWTSMSWICHTAETWGRETPTRTWHDTEYWLHACKADWSVLEMMQSRNRDTWAAASLPLLAAQQKLQTNSLKLATVYTHSESTFRFDIHYGEYCLIQDGITNIFTRFCVRCNLQKDTKNKYQRIDHSVFAISVHILQSLCTVRF